MIVWTYVHGDDAVSPNFHYNVQHGAGETQWDVAVVRNIPKSTE
jgi:hypothetical protein